VGLFVRYRLCGFAFSSAQSFRGCNWLRFLHGFVRVLRYYRVVLLTAVAAFCRTTCASFVVPIGALSRAGGLIVSVLLMRHSRLCVCLSFSRFS
jgi:hypothetical protein